MEYILHLAILVSIYAILSIGLNLVLGYTGLLSIAQAGFYGIGAYATALFLTGAGMNFFAALGLAMLAAACAALLIGLVLSRFSGDYYMLASLGFTAIVYTIFLNWDGVTRGPLGIPGIPRPHLFGFEFSTAISYFVLAIASAALCYFTARFIVNSSLGRVLKAIREDEQAIQVFGYRTFWYKLLIFVVGAAMAAFAGALYAAYVSFIDPSTFTVFQSVFILAIIILGGLASLRGSLIGAACLILLPELLRFVGFPDEIAAQLREALYGLVLILLMLYRPQGIFGEYKL